VYKSSDIFLEDNSHQPLKCSRGITISLLHSMAHECAINGGESRLPHVRRFNVYLFIHVGHIDLQLIFTGFKTGTEKPTVFPKRVTRVQVRYWILVHRSIPHTRTAVLRVCRG